MPYKVFISHSSRDTWVAEQIEMHLRRHGADTFLDAHDIAVGDSVQEVIFDEHLQQSQELLVLMTPSAFESKYVFMEIGAARGKRIRISVILYGIETGDVQREIRFPDVIASRNFLEINRIEEYFQQLKQRIVQNR